MPSSVTSGQSRVCSLAARPRVAWLVVRTGGDWTLDAVCWWCVPVGKDAPLQGGHVQGGSASAADREEGGGRRPSLGPCRPCGPGTGCACLRRLPVRVLGPEGLGRSELLSLSGELGSAPDSELTLLPSGPVP